MYDVDQIQVATRDESTKAKLESLIPQKLKNEILNSYKDAVKINDESTQRRKDVKILDKTFPEVANILIGFDIPEEDINFKRINETIKTDFLKKNDFENKYRCIRFDIQRSGKSIPTSEKVTKDNVILFLDIKPDFIQFLDEYKSGWGKGKEKKQLITPIINALAEKAKETGISNNIINEFKAKCSKELDAIFYTDANIIQEEVRKITKLIKSKEL